LNVVTQFKSMVVFIAMIISPLINAQSVVLYNTFGANDYYQTNWAADVGYHLNTDHVMVANGFSVASSLSSVYLDSIDVALMNPFNNDGGNAINLSLHEDLNGEPGSIIEAFDFDLAPKFSAQIYTLNSVLSPQLFASQNYWLVASSPDPLAELGWFWNGLSPFGDYTGPKLRQSSLNNIWIDDSSYGQQAFRVTASTSVVPVPAAAWLFGSGLIGLIGVARLRKA